MFFFPPPGPLCSLSMKGYQNSKPTGSCFFSWPLAKLKRASRQYYCMSDFASFYSNLRLLHLCLCPPSGFLQSQDLRSLCCQIRIRAKWCFCFEFCLISTISPLSHGPRLAVQVQIRLPSYMFLLFGTASFYLSTRYFLYYSLYLKTRRQSPCPALQYLGTRLCSICSCLWVCCLICQCEPRSK